MLIIQRLLKSLSFPVIYPKYYSSSSASSSPSLNFKNIYEIFNISSDSQSQIDKLTQSVLSGERAALAKSITLVESKNGYKRAMGQVILNKILIERPPSKTFRIGLSGPPGAGKSTFIESFGTLLTQVEQISNPSTSQNVSFDAVSHRVAVLAIDPSGADVGFDDENYFTGENINFVKGSILGDKTRMSNLTLNPKAYIRPSPSGGTLGGVAKNTNEAIQLCEGAGYDIIIVETMGVGQSEYAVANMVDMFCLLLPPAGGDELQGLKRGIVEVADMVIINKSDGNLLSAARKTASEYTSALKFMRQRYPFWRPTVKMVSSLSTEGLGLRELWQQMLSFRHKAIGNGVFERKRNKQAVTQMWGALKEGVFLHFQEDSVNKKLLKDVENEVFSLKLSPGIAAEYLLSNLKHQEFT